MDYINNSSFNNDPETNALIRRYFELKRRLLAEAEEIIETQLASGVFPEATVVIERVMRR
jgi:hypothetical protein